MEDCLLQFSDDLASGLGLGIDVASKSLTALPLLLPDFMPSQRGLPMFLARLAEVLKQPAGRQNIEGIAKVCHLLKLQS